MQFLELVTTPPKDGSPFDLLKPGDDAMKASLIRILLARSYLTSDELFPKKAERFTTLCQMLMPQEAEAQAQPQS